MAEDTRKADIFAALKALEDQQGRLTPQKVVDAARDPDSPLHAEFIWDDAVAAEKHRLDKARRLLRIKMTYRHRHHEFKLPNYIRDPDVARDKQGYVQTLRLASDADRAHAALVGEFKRAAMHLKRAREIAIGLELEEHEIADLEQRAIALSETFMPAADGATAH